MAPNVSEKLRQQLLAEEFRLRKKQPPAWAKAKYRRFARLPKEEREKERAMVEERKSREIISEAMEEPKNKIKKKIKARKAKFTKKKLRKKPNKKIRKAIKAKKRRKRK